MPRENTLLQVGDPAPDFALPDPAGRMMRLADLRGRRVALFFYRGTWCRTCQGLITQLRQQAATYERLGVQLLGVTTQGAPGVADYIRREQIPFPILIDAGRAVTRLYGVYNLISYEGINLPHNSIFLLDRAGVIRYIHVSVRSTDVPEEPIIRAALEAMGE
jgi:peroxiredoxin Q/BCP